MSNPVVAVVMGSTSDWPVMQHTIKYLVQFGIEYRTQVVSAHRSPDLLAEFGKAARGKRFRLYYRRRRWCGALTRNARRKYHSTGVGRTGANGTSAGPGFAVLDRANA